MNSEEQVRKSIEGKKKKMDEQNAYLNKLFDIETVTMDDDKNPAASGDKRPSTRPSDTYMNNTDLMQSIFDAGTTMGFRTVLIFMDNMLKPGEMMSALAVRDFFRENGLDADVIVDKRTFEKKNFYPEFAHEFIYHVPSDFTHFSALAVGIKCWANMMCYNVYRQSYLTFSVSYGKEATTNFAVQHLNAPDRQCTAELLYVMLRKLAADRNLTLSTAVKTKFLIAMMYTLRGQRFIRPTTIDTIRILTQDGADYTAASYYISKISMETLNCTKILLDRLTVKNRIAISRIPYDLIDQETPLSELRSNFDKSVHLFRNLDSADAWIVYIEQEPGVYYTILQTRKNLPYDMRKVAKKNNGLGTETFCRCVIYEMDIQKVQDDMRMHMLTTQRRLAAAQQSGNTATAITAE